MISGKILDVDKISTRLNVIKMERKNTLILRFITYNYGNMNLEVSILGSLKFIE